MDNKPVFLKKKMGLFLQYCQKTILQEHVPELTEHFAESLLMHPMAADNGKYHDSEICFSGNSMTDWQSVAFGKSK
ncbi:MAG: hypothetical protein IJ642_13065 [Oscillospiraceae bacterium]|nr:hypothetical protein [Oscillospiraceae bacterium]